MAQLLAVYEDVVSTDHALLCVRQGAGERGRVGAPAEVEPDGSPAEPGTASVVAQMTASGVVPGVVPGAVHMFAGQKNAWAVVRLERWDARPPEDDWEERDEVTFVELAGGGRATVHGYEGAATSDEGGSDEGSGAPGWGEGLDLSGIGRARVIVRACGRRRYPLWNANPREYSPEEWVLQFFPDPDPAVHPSRGPLDGPYALQPTLTSWGSAAQEWRRSGWRALIGDVPGVRDLALVLQAVDRPTTLGRLLPLMRWLIASPIGVPADESDLLPGLDGPVESARDVARARLDGLARLVAMPRVRTWAELAQALELLGLLVRWDCGDAVLVAPSFGPLPAWEDVRFTQEQRHSALRASVMDRAHDAADVAFLSRWSSINQERTLRQTAERAQERPRNLVPIWKGLGASAETSLESLLRHEELRGAFEIRD